MIFTERQNKRFLSNFNIQDNGCWDWSRGLNKDGYGIFGYYNKNLLAHRVSYNMYIGEIPNGLVINHLCENKSCVNPGHLEAVSRAINSIYSAYKRKGRVCKHKGKKLIVNNDKGRFFSYVKIPNNKKLECWQWSGSKSNSGYGRFGVNGKLKQAHRFAYELYFGDIEEGLVINHKCENRWCVNPYHLEAVTYQENSLYSVYKNKGSTKLSNKDIDNIIDLYKKDIKVDDIAYKYNIHKHHIYYLNNKYDGCIRNNKGSRHGMSKLNEDSVKEIKNLLLDGKMTNIEIANLFNVNDRCISDIKLNKSWKHVI